MFRRERSSILVGRVQEAMKIIPASDSSLLVVFGNTISPALHERVIALFHAFRDRHDPRIRNLHPGYASLLIDFNPLQWTHDELTATVWQLASKIDFEVDDSTEAVTVPVCYDVEFAPDLLAVARHAQLSVEEVIRLHSSPTYLV